MTLDMLGTILLYYYRENILPKQDYFCLQYMKLKILVNFLHDFQNVFLKNFKNPNEIKKST